MQMVAPPFVPVLKFREPEIITFSTDAVPINCTYLDGVPVVTKTGCFDEFACVKTPHEETADPLAPESDVAVIETVAVGAAAAGSVVRPRKNPILSLCVLFGRDERFEVKYKFDAAKGAILSTPVIAIKLLSDKLDEGIVTLIPIHTKVKKSFVVLLYTSYVSNASTSKL